MNFLAQHAVGITVASVYVFTAAVTSMNEQWDGFYNYLYRFTHALLPLAEGWLSRKRGANSNGLSANVQSNPATP